MKISSYIRTLSPFSFCAITGIRILPVLQLLQKTFADAVEEAESKNGGFTTWYNAWEWFAKTDAYVKALLDGINPYEQPANIMARLDGNLQVYEVEYRGRNYLVRPTTQGYWEAARVFDDLPDILDPDLRAETATQVIQAITGM